MLIWTMVEEFGKMFGKTVKSIPKKNMAVLERYAWPGNVRELRNLIERAMILNNGPTLIVDLPDGSVRHFSKARSLEDVERMHIVSVLEETGWRVRGSGKNCAAEVLKIKPTTLEARMKKLGIVRQYLSLV